MTPVQALLRHAGYEVMPLGVDGKKGGIEEKVVAHVPVEVPLSITMTATKGLDATLDLAESLSRRGYRVTPHIAARMVRDSAHLSDIAARLTDAHVDGIFAVAGDVPTQAGTFKDSVELLDTLAVIGHRFTHIGIGGYPEGHGTLSDEAIDKALKHKAQIATYIVTQMCFRPDVTAAWVRTVRDRGIDLPVYAGLPGAVTRQKLVRISATLGLGPSARYLLKQNNMLLRFFLPGGYRPDRLLRALGPDIAGVHFFTFNEVERTEAWRTARVNSDRVALGCR